MVVQYLYNTNYKIFRIKYHISIIKAFWFKKIKVGDDQIPSKSKMSKRDD
jgi:hypothetical protein